MYYTGIDLHRKTSFITTVDAKGQIVKKVNVLNDEATIFEYFLSLDDDILFVTVKSHNSCWFSDLTLLIMLIVHLDPLRCNSSLW